jgi:hypothetical protein
MSRTAVGRELMQVTVSSEVAQTIRLRAALDSVTPGTVIEQAIIATNVRQGVMSQLSQGSHELKPSLTTRTRTKPVKASKPKPKQSKEGPTGEEWTETKLHKAMEREGLTGRALAERLESGKGTPPQGVQVNRWSRGAEKIPAHYWSQLDRIFGGGK